MTKYELIGLAGILIVAVIFIGFLSLIIRDTLLEEKR